MNIVYLLMPLALLLGFAFAAGFVRMVTQGQYDELETPPHRMLLDDEVVVRPTGSKRSEERQV
jgi:cbb3-type cytochrome oxidase maturation protein